MPKRRITPARLAQIRAFQAAGVAARKRRSFSNPIPERKAPRNGGSGMPAAIPGSFGTVRRHKLGGKAYQKKSAGAVHIAAEAQQILSGAAGFRSQLAADMSHQGPAKVPKPRSSWYTKHPSPQAIRAVAVQRAARGKRSKIIPSKAHGSGTGVTAEFRYLGRVQ